MSLFDTIRRFFNPTPEEKADKFRKRILNMYGHTEDRKYALHELHDLGPELAPPRLIARFTVQCDNGATDTDEKQYTKDLLVDLGRVSIAPLKDFLRHNDTDFSWPYQTLCELLTHEELVEFLIELLKTIGPEYVRFPERKEQLMLTLKSFDEEEIKVEILPYLGDENETVRFNAADTVIAHAHPKGIEALAERLAVETSQRVLNLIAAAFREKEWAVPEDKRERVSTNLPQDCRMNDKGIIL